MNKLNTIENNVNYYPTCWGGLSSLSEYDQGGEEEHQQHAVFKEAGAQ